MNPSIRLMLDKLGIIEMHDSLSGMSIRSKYFLGYNEVLKHAQKDFRQKLSKIFPQSEDSNENETTIKGMTIMNPKYAMVDTEDERFQNQEWDDNCFGTVFFCNDVESDDDNDEFPQAWMVKYEIFYEDDIIQLICKNGEHAFDPVALAYQSFSSALH